VIEEKQMERTDSYIVVDRMIRQGEINGSELENLLEALVKQEQITPAERQALLKLAVGINAGTSPG
jgi:hypothetical protein